MIQGTESNSIDPYATPKPSLSKLESLPTEILEFIFLYSRNVTLPSVSLTLCRALSSPRLKYLTLRSILMFPCLQELTDDESEELGKVQSAFLRCKWVDYPTIQRGLIDLRATALARYFECPTVTIRRNGTKVRLPDNVVRGPDHPFLDMPASKIREYLDSIDTQNRDGGHWIWEWVSDTNHKSVLRLPLRHFEPVTFHQFRSYYEPYIELGYGEPICKFQLASGCEVPTKVLHGPWDDAKKDFLQLIMSGGARFDWVNGNSGEVAESSVKEAILQGRIDVLKQLTNYRSVVFPVRNRDWPPCWGVILTQEHLRLAILEAGCKREVVENITCITDLGDGYSLRDGDIVNWAIEKDAQGDERGTWLLDYMAEMEPE
ncbi:MAG: hypothetical protein Q9218_007494 [Villophora microphyllina]